MLLSILHTGSLQGVARYLQARLARLKDRKFSRREQARPKDAFNTLNSYFVPGSYNVMVCRGYRQQSGHCNLMRRPF